MAGLSGDFFAKTIGANNIQTRAVAAGQRAELRERLPSALSSLLKLAIQSTQSTTSQDFNGAMTIHLRPPVDNVNSGDNGDMDDGINTLKAHTLSEREWAATANVVDEFVGLVEKALSHGLRDVPRATGQFVWDGQYACVVNRVSDARRESREESAVDDCGENIEDAVAVAAAEHPEKAVMVPFPNSSAAASNNVDDRRDGVKPVIVEATSRMAQMTHASSQKFKLFAGSVSERFGSVTAQAANSMSVQPTVIQDWDDTQAAVLSASAGSQALFLTLWDVVANAVPSNDRQLLREGFSQAGLKTGAGRARSWLRMSLNSGTLLEGLYAICGQSSDGNLEDTTHARLRDKTRTTLLENYYYDWAFIRSAEDQQFLLSLLGGLQSINFDILDTDSAFDNSGRTPALSQCRLYQLSLSQRNLGTAPETSSLGPGQSTVPGHKVRRKTRKKKVMAMIGDGEATSDNASQSSTGSKNKTFHANSVFEQFSSKQEDNLTAKLNNGAQATLPDDIDELDFLLEKANTHAVAAAVAEHSPPHEQRKDSDVEDGSFRYPTATTANELTPVTSTYSDNVIVRDDGAGQIGSTAKSPTMFAVRDGNGFAAELSLVRDDSYDSNNSQIARALPVSIAGNAIEALLDRQTPSGYWTGPLADLMLAIGHNAAFVSKDAAFMDSDLRATAANPSSPDSFDLVASYGRLVEQIESVPVTSGFEVDLAPSDVFAKEKSQSDDMQVKVPAETVELVADESAIVSADNENVHTGPSPLEALASGPAGASSDCETKETMPSAGEEPLEPEKLVFASRSGEKISEDVLISSLADGKNHDIDHNMLNIANRELVEKNGSDRIVEVLQSERTASADIGFNSDDDGSINDWISIPLRTDVPIVDEEESTNFSSDERPRVRSRTSDSTVVGPSVDDPFSDVGRRDRASTAQTLGSPSSNDAIDGAHIRGRFVSENVDTATRLAASASSSSYDISGYLQKRGHDVVGVWRTRYFILSSSAQMLQYFVDTAASEPKGVVDLRDASVQFDPAKPNFFQIVTSSEVASVPSRTYWLYAKSASDCAGWVDALMSVTRRTYTDQTRGIAAPIIRPRTGLERLRARQIEQKQTRARASDQSRLQGNKYSNLLRRASTAPDTSQPLASSDSVPREGSKRYNDLRSDLGAQHTESRGVDKDQSMSSNRTSAQLRSRTVEMVAAVRTKVVATVQEAIVRSNTTGHISIQAIPIESPPKITLQDQGNRCFDCGASLRSGLIFSATRFCEFTGMFFCKQCHTKEMAIIPANAIMFWDLVPRPVCNAAAAFITRIFDEPAIFPAKLNPSLYRDVPSLARVRLLRLQLREMRFFIMTCDHNRESLLRPVAELSSSVTRRVSAHEGASRLHLIDSTDLFSLGDLVDLAAGELLPLLRKVSERWAGHVSRCRPCSEKGSFCNLCNDRGRIFPWHLRDIARCRHCNKLFHIGCFKSGVDRCISCGKK